MAEAEAQGGKMKPFGGGGAGLDAERGRFPYCVVWTPIPVLTWLFPIIGHMGICTSAGIIRDFAGPYYVSEDNMAFGRPVKYWKLDPNKVYSTSPNAWDTAVHDASEEYKHRMHNLCCDNCHSHVALALNLMRYDNSSSWNMVKLCFFSLLYGKYVRGICEDVASLCPLLGGNPDSRFNPSLAVMGPVIFPSPWCPEEEPWLLSPARWRHRTLGIT
ncbi:PREDICTED: transmembrane protein 222 isoform X2 [Crocodylus porosus]|uniref:transmembrane protein 222 isoform X2 n=1 Tax=Crocodylus porosus TaxID=8502 RepID=UPI0009401175|nr:PREDICTED: transmembrane protein 222 isoform X2 [Crocodylus porosus]